MSRRRTVLAIPIPVGGVEVADVLAVLNGVAPGYDLTRLEYEAPGVDGVAHLVLTAGQRRVRGGPTLEETGDDEEVAVPGALFMGTAVTAVEAYPPLAEAVAE